MNCAYRRISLFLICCLGLALIAGTDTFAQTQSAEPAPVPKAVAIGLTDEEMQLAERSLAQFLEKADPEVQELNRKYPGLFSVKAPPPRAHSAIVPNLAPFFQT